MTHLTCSFQRLKCVICLPEDISERHMFLCLDVQVFQKAFYALGTTQHYEK